MLYKFLCYYYHYYHYYYYHYYYLLLLCYYYYRYALCTMHSALCATNHNYSLLCTLFEERDYVSYVRQKPTVDQ
jgi:hypothetical protein